MLFGLHTGSLPVHQRAVKQPHSELTAALKMFHAKEGHAPVELGTTGTSLMSG